MMNDLKRLPNLFGSKSQLARHYIPAIYALGESSQYQAWHKDFLPTAPKKLNTETIANHYALQNHDPLRLIFALQSYYALLVKLLAAYRLGSPASLESIETGEHFRQHAISNFCENDVYSLAGKLDFRALQEAASSLSYKNSPPDALKALYRNLFPRTLRHTLGEYYTPDWLAHFVLERLDYQPGRLLDPTCGSGSFLAMAFRRLNTLGISSPLAHLAGIDVNPLACLSAKANLLLALDSWETPLELPIYCADVLLNPPDLGKFSFIVGNPPWVNWETLPQNYREASKALWMHHELFPHHGFEAILGKGKKDIALLLTYAVMDKYLADDGKMAFILTQSVLKSSGAAEGFRRFQGKFKPQSVDDFSRFRLFSGAATRPIVLYLAQGEVEPLPYTFWDSPHSTIPDDAALNIIDSFQKQDFLAEAIGKTGSAWLTGEAEALHALRKLRGKSPYQAHAGVYTGGANAVYWLEILSEENGFLRVRNLPDKAKILVPAVECLIEADFVFPLLRGRDVKRWQANPGAHILMVQDPQKRRGYDEKWLAEHFPLTYTYLAQFEDFLRERTTLKRYFKASVPFYSMFDVGEYSFAPYKVVWHGFGKKRMAAAVIGSIDGKAIMSNQAMHPFIGLHNETEAHYLAACLNSLPFEYAVISHTQTGGKSFAQSAILNTLNIPLYQPENPLHLHLAELSRAAHRGQIDDEQIAQATAQLWNLSPAELAAIQKSFQQLID